MQDSLLRMLEIKHDFYWLFYSTLLKFLSYFKSILISLQKLTIVDKSKYTQNRENNRHFLEPSYPPACVCFCLHFLTYPHEEFGRSSRHSLPAFPKLSSLSSTLGLEVYANSQNACISLSTAASSTPSVLIYDDDRKEMLLWAAGSMSSTRLQKTATILPGDGQEDELPHELVRQETAGTECEHSLLHGCIHPEEKHGILFQHSANCTRGGL